MNIKTFFKNKAEVYSAVTLAALVLVVLPLLLPIFRLNLFGKYLTFGFVGVGLVLLWGRCGILSLGQGVFFGLGGYCMAMFLKLEASDPISTKIQSTPGIPDFMDWNQITKLPWFWEPFKSFPFAMAAILVIPTLVAFGIGWAMFRRRVGGVYFAIITQAIALIISLGIDGNQGYTGGRNGITDLRTLLGMDIRSNVSQYIIYYIKYNIRLFYFCTELVNCSRYIRNIHWYCNICDRSISNCNE
jgi:urea transport system permease protein